jgi:hypothetical protein
MSRRLLVLIVLALGLTTRLSAQESGSYVYRTVFLRAAPGLLLELIEALKRTLPTLAAAGDPAPLLARHSQGDHWDLLIVQPVGTLAEWYGPDHAARWQAAEARTGFSSTAFRREVDPLVAWQQELFVAGPPLEVFEARNQEAGFYHIEVFLALAGRRDSLLHQRAMENVYLTRIGRPTNLIFRRVAGAEWDAYTIGYYRDLQHYAEPLTITAEQEEQAAQAAGFQSRNQIGSYLRRFLAGHHDTLLSRIR